MISEVLRRRLARYAHVAGREQYRNFGRRGLSCPASVSQSLSFQNLIHFCCLMRWGPWSLAQTRRKARRIIRTADSRR